MGFFKDTSKQNERTLGTHLSHCGGCGLYKKCLSPKMEVSGKGRKKILFVAEAPGKAEDRRGIQLVGEAGQVLREALHDIGEELDDCWKTNAVICRPPENKMESKYIEACRPNLLRTIKKLKPKVIVLLGGSAIRSLISTEWQKDLGGMSRWIGWNIPSHNYGWVCPTYHPSYILRLGKEKPLTIIFREHLRQAFSLEDVPPPSLTLEALKSEIEIIQSPRLVRLKLRDLAKKEGKIAFDYETTGLKPDGKKHKIISCSICFEQRETFAFMMDNSIKPYLSKVLLSKRLGKVASNMKFEERWTRAKLGHPVENWFWDTMLAAHVIDNRSGITSIKFLSYIYYGIGDYDSHISPYLHSKIANGLNRIDEIDKKELLVYNGLDSLQEFRVMEKQRRILK